MLGITRLVFNPQDGSSNMKKLLQNHKLLAILCPFFSIIALILSFALDEPIRELTRKTNSTIGYINFIFWILLCLIFWVAGYIYQLKGLFRKSESQKGFFIFGIVLNTLWSVVLATITTLIVLYILGSIH
jgi:Na+-driven multidrug efflux pump